MKTDTVIIGAGVVGLAMAKEISRKGHEVVVLEQHSRSGEETSSRNSGVIHSGIYYPKDSNKALSCVEGNRLLYEYANKRNIWHRNTGKLVVATTHKDVDRLESLLEKGNDNGVEGLKLLSKKEVKKIQPEIKAELALFCPSSGIVDAADLILKLEAELQQKEVIISFNSKVKEIKTKSPSGFVVYVTSSERFNIEADNVVNSAGLHAVELARNIRGMPEDLIPQAYYAKGHYFHLSGSHPFNKNLVYPLNTKDSLGIHVSVDMSGKARFGPDVSWVEDLDYKFDESLKDRFVKDIQSYWPELNSDKLFPDYVGIRPKIYGPKEEPADFIIQTYKEHGVQGLVNLFGIESPGLTSSLALAKKVGKILN